MRKIVAVLIVLLGVFCSPIAPRSQEVDCDSQGRQTLNVGRADVKDEVTLNCENLRRPLNPAAHPSPSASDLDRYFYLAYERETEGDFDGSILHYRKAAELSQCDCDRLHAEAGEKVAMEAKKLFDEKGMAVKPTQFFWGRMQQLTQALPCVKIEQ